MRTLRVSTDRAWWPRSGGCELVSEGIVTAVATTCAGITPNSGACFRSKLNQRSPSRQHISPEDWPGVLANLRRAAQPDGLMYLTVHELDRHHLDRAFASLAARGLPAVWGELSEPDTPGYYYCPGRDQAVEWFGQQGLVIADEGFRRENGWGYRHFLLRTQPVNAAGPASPRS